MSKKIRVITDSVCDLPQDLLEKWKIDIVPLLCELRWRELCG